jgi:hypothetical protein
VGLIVALGRPEGIGRVTIPGEIREDFTGIFCREYLTDETNRARVSRNFGHRQSEEAKFGRVGSNEANP